MEPRRGGHGARPRRPPGRGRAGLRLAGRPAARRRLVAPVLPGRPGRAGQARRQRHAPTSPPACGTTGCCTERPRASSRRMWPVVERGHRLRARPADRRGARSSGPATPTARRGASPCSPARRAICHSLRCAIAIAEHLGHERPDWELSAARLAHVIRTEPDAFAPKHRWAMDWYYPVLGGVLARRRRPRAARRPLRHVRRSRAAACAACPTGRGSPRPRRASACWPTSPSASASTRRAAVRLGAAVPRADDGRYWTGTVYPDEVHFPGGEQSTYTAAAVVLAADALAGRQPGLGALRRPRRRAPRLV